MPRRSDHTKPQLQDMAVAAASRIIENNGLRAVSIRRIAEAIGYTSGTLYQLFENLDALIIEVHIGTLTDLNSACEGVEFGGDPEKVLNDLAQRYADFANANRNRWNALFEHSLPDGKTRPERYNQAVLTLIGLGARALEPILPAGDEHRAFHEARVLWSSLYGIVSLETSGKQSVEEDADALITSLFKNYMAGLKANS